MVELVDTSDLKSDIARYTGSSPVPGTIVIGNTMTDRELIEAAERERICQWLEHGVDLSALANRQEWLEYTIFLLAECAIEIRANNI